jgi:hypothetical protein
VSHEDVHKQGPSICQTFTPKFISIADECNTDIVDIAEIFSRQKCMGKAPGRRIIPAVATDLSIHSYMHKNTNKRQHS